MLPAARRGGPTFDGGLCWGGRGPFGLRRDFDLAGVASNCTVVWRGESLQGSDGGGKIGAAPAAIGSRYGEAAQICARDPPGGSAEESGGSCGALRAESVGSADALSGGWGTGNRQRRQRASQPPHRDWSRQLDVLRQRQWRPDGVCFAKLYRDVQAE